MTAGFGGEYRNKLQKQFNIACKIDRTVGQMLDRLSKLQYLKVNGMKPVLLELFRH